MRDPKTNIDTPLPGGYLQAEIIKARPGRLAVNYDPAPPIPPKPTADETPYRSLFYVTSRNSADGNDYAKDEPIPFEEAERQGLVTGEAQTMTDLIEELAAEEAVLRLPKRAKPKVRIPDPEYDNWSLRTGQCPKCRGTGKRSYKVSAKHQPDCACPACKPCKNCGGTGEVSNFG